MVSVIIIVFVENTNITVFGVEMTLSVALPTLKVISKAEYFHVFSVDSNLFYFAKVKVRELIWDG